IAKLDRIQLEQLGLGRSGRAFAEVASGTTPPSLGITLAVIGAAYVRRIESDDVDLSEAGVVSFERFASLDEASAKLANKTSDILLVSVASLHEDVASQVLSLGET
ncbi:hypothetical protein QMO17_36565, partial [Klebsiella pneumoniae]|nr:hypothetical protein [Klebsiella pneumoniae]